MKNRCRTRWTTSFSILKISVFTFLLTSFTYFHSSSSIASNELDRQFRLETVGVLKAWDNVDGLFVNYVEDAYRSYFEKSSRFKQIDLSKSSDLLQNSEIAYRKIIEDQKVLEQVARTFRVESLIRTKVFKEGRQYRFQVEWLHSPRMETISRHSFHMEQPLNGEALGASEIDTTIQKGLSELIQKVPFQGHVTGRDRVWATVNMGEGSGLKPGDLLRIGTLEEIQIHPLLKTIVDWKFIPTGSLVVDEVDEDIAFCKIDQQNENQEIARYQKVLKVLPGELPSRPVEVERMDGRKYDDTLKAEQRPPTMGFAGGGMWLGSFSRTYTANNDPLTKSGIGLGFDGIGQLWLTREFFADLEIGYGFVPGGQVSLFKGALGYYFFVNREYVGPKGYLRAGYQSKRYSLSNNSGEGTWPNTFSGLFLGLGGELPVRDNYGALMSFDIGVFPSYSETGVDSGGTNGLGDVSFYLGGYYQLAPSMSIRAGLKVILNSADFASGSTISQRVISFAPYLLYYF